ncbi:hypothetical protein [Rhodoligotrophos ferricapiens]|uniref:hypothetical protein n=1 Tax=Rhodoligotrophos ferricapiens TaxID=3069264 RepID=UPI00315DB655
MIAQLVDALNWVDWEVEQSKSVSAMGALRQINDSDPHMRVDPHVLGARIALGSLSGTNIFATREGHHLDQAALLFSKVKPQNLSFDPHSPLRLSVLRKSYFDALAREWLKARLFTPEAAEDGEGARPRFESGTIVNAVGKTITDLAEMPALTKLPGIDRLSDAARHQLVEEWAREAGLDTHHKIGTIEFSLACIVRQRAIARNEVVPEGLDDRRVLLRVFQDEIRHWQQHPNDSFNPYVEAAFHLARSSGDKFTGTEPEQILQEALSYFSERWAANFGKPPSFDRAEAALAIMEKASGQSRDDLEYEERGFSSTEAFGLTETVSSTPLERFLQLADRPGLGHTLPLRCEHNKHHGVHVIYPRSALQEAEEAYNSGLSQQPWVIARAKENLRLGGSDLSPDAVDAEIARIVGNYQAETEAHRHLISGLHFLKDWVISQIPIVGGIYNIEEGIRHGDIKQIIGGAIALTLDAAFAAVAGRGRIAEVSPEVASGVARLASEHGSAPLKELAEAAAAAIRPVQEGETFSDIPRRFTTLDAGMEKSWPHPVTGRSLTVTKIQSTGEIVALDSVPGQKGTFRAVDWISGESRRGAELDAYHRDPGTGRIEKGGKLQGGGQCCSDPSSRPNVDESDALSSFPRRMADLIDRTTSSLVFEYDETGVWVQNASYYDLAGLDYLPKNWEHVPPDEVASSSPGVNGPTKARIVETGDRTRGDALGPAYLYEGRYWSFIDAPNEALGKYRAARADMRSVRLRYRSWRATRGPTIRPPAPMACRWPARGFWSRKMKSCFHLHTGLAMLPTAWWWRQVDIEFARACTGMKRISGRFSRGHALRSATLTQWNLRAAGMSAFRRSRAKKRSSRCCGATTPSPS